jgi:hypothetical protein
MCRQLVRFNKEQKAAESKQRRRLERKSRKMGIQKRVV